MLRRFIKRGQKIDAEILAVLEPGTEYHGYEISRRLERRVGFGTLYGTLHRLENEGYLESRVEDHEVAEREHRPRRYYYKLTAKGEQRRSIDNPT